jgi:hypothetical protein
MMPSIAWWVSYSLSQWHTGVPLSLFQRRYAAAIATGYRGVPYALANEFHRWIGCPKRKQERTAGMAVGVFPPSAR